VNYVINHQDGSYMMKLNGKFSDSNPVSTKNLLFSPSGAVVMKDDTVGLPRKQNAHILGLEDVRVYTNAHGKLCFTATTAEFSEKIRIVQGDYNLTTASYSNCKVLESPTQQECEKNWIAINGTNNIIYKWHPYQIGTIEGNSLAIHTTYETPWFFQHLRGSAIPIQVEDEIWALVHFVEYTTPRKYYHCFVTLEPMTYKPLSISLPFTFRSSTIEYCLACNYTEGKISFVFSTMDDNPCMTSVPVSTFQFLQV